MRHAQTVYHPAYIAKARTANEIGFAVAKWVKDSKATDTPVTRKQAMAVICKRLKALKLVGWMNQPDAIAAYNDSLGMVA